VRNRFKKIAALTLTLIFMVPLALIAADWQWNRHHEREALNAKLERSYTQEPKKVASFNDLTSESLAEYCRVKVQGEIISDITWWRKQSLDGIPGFVGLVQLEVNNSFAVVLALGWSQQPIEVALNKNVDSVARIKLINNFEADPSDLPINQTNTPASLIPGGGKIYLELISPPIEKIAILPLPEMTAGPHLGYVGQWILIAIFALVVYVIAIRNLPTTD
jgi:cytochrome oxidase assembly protein ShyY1